MFRGVLGKEHFSEHAADSRRRGVRWWEWRMKQGSESLKVARRSAVNAAWAALDMAMASALRVPDFEDISCEPVDLLGGDANHGSSGFFQGVQNGLTLVGIVNALVADDRPFRTDGQHHIGVVDGRRGITRGLIGCERLKVISEASQKWWAACSSVRGRATHRRPG